MIAFDEQFEVAIGRLFQRHSFGREAKNLLEVVWAVHFVQYGAWNAPGVCVFIVDNMFVPEGPEEVE
ncbi:MAG: hypothetical protein ACM336_04280 [Acidobacteriota bacterium]